MKKLLALLLLSPLVVSEEVEYPIEITCEFGANIIYLYFDETHEMSWWKNHPSNNSQTGGGIAGRGPFGDKKFKDKKNKFKKINLISNSRIEAIAPQYYT